MDFSPPLIHYIEQVLPFIENNPAFIVVNKGWYTTIDYVWNSSDTFNNSFARECRGLKFRSDTGAIIARPYHKFHNLGECAGYFTSDVDLSLPHTILDKLDGSMIHTAINPEDGKIVLMTRMGHTDQAKMAEAFVDRVTIDGNGLGHRLASMVFDNPRSTFIFEYVGPNNRIVIPYPEEKLIMTGIRDIYTGEYTTMALMAAMAVEYDIPCVGPYSQGIEPMSADYYMQKYVTADEEKEGCVIRFESGAMVKMKSSIYVRKHKSKELTESNKGVVQLIVDGNLDDVIPQLDGEVGSALQAYQNGFLDQLGTLVEGFRHILSSTKDMDQKTFALHIQAHYPKTTQKVLFATRKSNDSHSEVLKLIKNRYNKEAELVPLLEELGFDLWLA